MKPILSMKAILSILLTLSLIFFYCGCGPQKFPTDPTDTTPPTFLVTYERVDKETSRSDGSVDISTESKYIHLTNTSKIKVHIQVFDRESGVRSVSFVKQAHGKELLWACENSPGRPGANQSADMVFVPALPAATGAESYGVLVTTDPYDQVTTCGNLPLAMFHGWIQIEAVNGAGRSSRSGELHFEK